jgi:hypothetical protein
VNGRLTGFAFPFRIADADVPPGTPRTAGVARSVDAEKIRDEVGRMLGVGVAAAPPARKWRIWGH